MILNPPLIDGFMICNPWIHKIDRQVNKIMLIHRLSVFVICVVDFSSSMIVLLPSFQRFVHEMNSFCEKSCHGAMQREGSHQL
jgi:hypothetical protein